MSVELLRILTQLKPDDPQVAQYINAQNENAEFGNVVLDAIKAVLDSQSSPEAQEQLIINLSYLLKKWIKSNYMKMNLEQLTFYFNYLKSLICSVQNQLVLHFSASFYDIAEKVRLSVDIPVSCYESQIPDFLAMLSDIQNCSISQIVSILQILDLLVNKESLKRNHTLEELSPLFDQIIQIIIPILSNPGLFQQAEGPRIIELVLKIFKHIFFFTPNSIELAQVPIAFCTQIESLYVSGEMQNTKIVCSAIEFMTAFYQDKSTKSFFETDVNALLTKYCQILANSLQGEREPYFISRILLAIEPFVKQITPQPDIIAVLLESSVLLQNDVSNFTQNPSSFYYDVYDTEGTPDTAQRISRSLITNILTYAEDKQSIISYLMTIQDEQGSPKENAIRCLALCLSQLTELPAPIFEYATQLIGFIVANPNPLLSVSILFLLKNMVNRSPIEFNTGVMEHLPFFFSPAFKDFPVINLFAIQLLTELVKNEIDPFDNAAEAVIETLPNSFTGDAADCLRTIASVYPEAVLPHAEVVIENISERIQQSFEEIQQSQEEGNDDMEENAIENIESQIEFAGQLISNAGGALVVQFMLETVKFILDNSLTEIPDNGDSLLFFLKAIFKTNSELLPAFVELILSSFENEIWIGFCGYLLTPFLEMISSNLQVYLSLNLSPHLIETCVKLMSCPQMELNPDNFFDLGALISFVVGADSLQSSGTHPEYLGQLVELSKSIYQEREPKPTLLSVFNEINAALFVSFDVPVEENIIQCIFASMEQNVAKRNYQKLLYAIFFLNLAQKANQYAGEAVPIAFRLLSQYKGGNENEEEEDNHDDEPNDFDYLTLPFDYNSPFEHIQVNQLISTSLGLFDAQDAEQIRQQYSHVITAYLSGQEA